MQNEEIAKVLDEIGDMLELAGENFFRVRAYHNAARTIRDQPVAVAELSPKQIDQIPGIGADLAGKITTLVNTGEMPLHRELAAKFPKELLELRNIPGLGPKRVKVLADLLHVHGRDDLERAVRSGKLRTIRGFGAKSEERILQALSKLSVPTGKRILISEASVIAANLIAHLRKCRAIKELEVAGSFRRRRETIGDLDLVASSTDYEPCMKQVKSFPDVAAVLGSGETKTTVSLKSGLQVDLRVVPPASFGAALLYFTGSKAHNIHLRKIAQGLGLLLNEYGLFRDSKMIGGRTEQEVFKALDLQWIAPELREDRGEIEAASENRLPKLITRSDLRGDLHTHSTYTDGRSSIEEMARKAREVGLEYFAVTDHSRRVAMAHGLDPRRLREQWREIEQVEAKLNGIKLLRGIEVDILDDGKLDLPDDVLSELDWVVASLHYSQRGNPAELTRRLVNAIHNKNVDVIGHPSGRLLGHREPYEFDLKEVLHAAHDEGCALEVNSQPDRLDLNDTACLAAKHAGVKLVISSDSHSPREFEQLDYGVSQARRGWLEPEDVINTRPLKSLHRRH